MCLLVRRYAETMQNNAKQHLLITYHIICFCGITTTVPEGLISYNKMDLLKKPGKKKKHIDANILMVYTYMSIYSTNLLWNKME